MSNSQSKPSPAVIQVQGVSVYFLLFAGVLEVLLSIRWIAWLVSGVPLLRRLLERKTILANISFEVHEGQRFGIFGVNAAGKSTLLYLLCGLLGPRKGRVLIQGRDVLSYRGQLPISKCGRNELYDSFSAVENAQFFARLYGLNVTKSVAFVQNLLDQLQLSRTDQNEMVERLSFGSRGKVALVCSLLPLLKERPDDAASPILLLDEPTVGFDVLSVEIFFDALNALHRAMPKLTIVLATNDPREMAFCDDYIAIVDNQLVGDGHGAFAHLKQAIVSGRESIRAASSIIGKAMPDLSAVGAFGDLRVPADSGSNAYTAIIKRTLRDIIRFPTVSLMVVFSIVVPNLLGLFASAQARGLWHATIMMIFGLFVTSLMREAQRFMDRERNWYRMLESVLLSPVSRRTHYLASAMTSCLYHLCQLSAVSGLLFGFIFLAGSEPFPTGLGPTSASDWFGLCATVVVMIAAVQAMGLMVVYLPFILRPLAAFFIIGTIPGLTVLLSGIYFPASSLPWGIRHIAYVNPATYGSFCFNEFLGLKLELDVPTVTAIAQHIPFVAPAHLSLAVLLILTLLYTVLAIWIFCICERFLIWLGRVRRQT